MESMSDPRLVVVLSPYQNAFFPELAEVLVDELTGAGVANLVTTEPGQHRVEPDDVFVLLPPHEYIGLEGTDFVDDPLVAGRTIGISAEQPHQRFFERNAEYGARLGAVLDFSPLAVEAYRRAGVSAEHLQFGYTSRWDRHRPGQVSSGPPRVLYLGNKRSRRLRVLAEAAEVLSRRGTRLLVSDNDVPNRSTTPTFVAGEDKRDLLASTRLLINIHQGDEPYFEWLRFAEAAHCGTPVLSERSAHTAPFVAGEDFAEFVDGQLGAAIERLVDDDARLTSLVESAYDRLRAHPLSNSVDVLVHAARQVLANRPPASLPARTRSVALGSDRQSPPSTVGRDLTRTARRRRSTSRNALDITVVVGTDADGVAEFVSERRPGGETLLITPDELTPRRLHRLGDGLVLIVPPGCRVRSDSFDQLLAAGSDGGPAACWSAVIDGFDESGAPTLEGVWPWEPWRLRSGQHLGRLMVTSAGVLRGAADLFDHEVLRQHPHAAVQAWIASQGGVGGHVPSPVAHVTGIALDVEQRLPEPVAALVLAWSTPPSRSQRIRAALTPRQRTSP